MGSGSRRTPTSVRSVSKRAEGLSSGQSRRTATLRANATEPTRTPLTLLGDAVSNAAMFAAVLVLGEAVRSRQALDQEHRLLLAEQERSERLLLNVLPAPIAARLKQGEAVIADGFPEVSVLFADIVDFTRRSQASTPAQVVQVLDGLFSALDRLAQRHGLEKI